LKYYGGGGVGRTKDNYWYDDVFSSYAGDLLQAAQTATDKSAFANSLNATQHAHSRLKAKWTGGAGTVYTEADVGTY
jgi:hypothetical protein